MKLNKKYSIYTVKRKVKFSSEQIILFGLLDKLYEEDKHCYNFNNKSRYNGILEFCKNNINYVDNIKNCDILVLPYKFKNIDDKLFIVMSNIAKNFKKELWCFYNDDNHKTFKIENHVKLFRTSFNKTKKLENEYPLIAFSPDYFNNKIISDKILSIGYCGHKMHGRDRYLKIFDKSLIKTNFIIRNGFWAPGINKLQARHEYFENMESNIFIFCYRGAGNFSYRFYETLMMGRIPILIDTDCVIPNFELLIKNNCCIHIKEEDIKEDNYIIEKINEYYTKNIDNLIEIQKNNRKFWETYYSPIGFLSNSLMKIKITDKKIFNLENFLKKYNLFWQYPVITEKSFYLQNKNNKNYFGFPWSTIFDKNINIIQVIKLLQPFIDKNKTYYTCCQHISFRKLIPYLKLLNINKLYSPHKTIGENEINGIKILPCPLYAVNVEDSERNKLIKETDILNCERNILYSFAGGYQPNDYLTDIRAKIFQLKSKSKSNIYIKNTGDWHFNKVVYNSKQNHKGELNEDNSHKKKTYEYNELLLKSRYTLCPSGSGPNSIRFWEALGTGSIPILLADTLELPENKDWTNTIIRIKENEISKIDEILSKIDEKKENEMRINCLKLYNYFRNNYRNQKVLNNKKVTLFTSYLCDKKEPIIQNILSKWKILNPEHEILYFSDIDVQEFFKDTEYFNIYKKMKNGVAIADFFRICYINKFGGFWFDIDIEPIKFNILNNNNVNLFDCGYGNISYMFIGGKKNQPLFQDVINNVIKNIENNIPDKFQHVMEITGPRVIQNLIFRKLNIINKDNNFKGELKEKIYLKDTKYEFSYKKIILSTTKTNEYKKLQNKYNKKSYFMYNYV